MDDDIPYILDSQGNKYEFVAFFDQIDERWLISLEKVIDPSVL